MSKFGLILPNFGLKALQFQNEAKYMTRTTNANSWSTVRGCMSSQNLV